MSASASPAQRLRELTASAMIGTDRSGAGKGATSKLLAEAAVAGALMRGGKRARTIGESVPVCPADPVPVAPAAAMATLLRLLGEPDAGLLEEWAELARVKKVRVADSVVPVLLDWWARQPRRPEAVHAVLGVRGEWLASMNAAWRKPVAGAEVPVNAEEIWQTGKTPERLAVLLTVRRFDPARALALVQATWQSDGADERRRFVEVLRERVSMADEPFLEGALDDKSKVVRRQAAIVLASLVGSRLLIRMNERAKGMIVVEGKRGVLKRSAKVSLSPPEAFDKAWERDGLEEQAASGMGKRAWWMRQVLSAADLSVWTETLGLEPAGVIEAIKEDDYFGNALESMIEAAGSRGDAAWCGPILRHLLGGKKLEAADLSGLWANLAPELSGPLILEAAEHKRFSGTDRWGILATAEYRWSPEFSVSALKLLRKQAPRKGEVWGLYEPVERLSRVIAPECAEEFVETVLAMFPDEPSDSFKRSIDRVRLRADMHKEFAS